MTDRYGSVAFATIFPGFYAGRVNHVHLKVHVLDDRHRICPGRVVHTGQVFFPEDVARAISSQPPYAAHRIERTTLRDDPVFIGESGKSSIADVQRVGHSGAVAWIAALTVHIDKAASPMSWRAG